MTNTLRRLLASAIFLLPLPCVAGELPTIGWAEEARVYPGHFLIIAKLDTGSLSASVNARNIELYKKDDETRVRFDVVNRAGRSHHMDLPVVREVKIKEYQGKKDVRPVVLLGICIGGTYAQTEVSLVDREGFLYPLLIGRRYIKGHFVIDPSRKYTVKPRCQVDPASE